MNKKTIFLIFTIFIFAFILRVIFLPQKALTFGYDQARDAFTVQEILNGDFKILGPPASTPGLYHGVFYYYLLAPAYFVGGGSPIFAAYWIAFLNALVVILIFYLTYFLTKKTGTSLLASFLFAISFESTQYATWLSNPTIGIWTVPLTYLGLWAWLKERRKWGAVICALGLGLSIQGEVFLAYHLIPIILWLWVGRKDVKKQSLVYFFTALIFTLFSMLLVEFKFGFRGISGVANLLSGQDVFISARNLGDFIVLYLNQFGRIFTNSVLPSNSGYGGVLGLLVLWWLIKELRKVKDRGISWQAFLGTFILAHLPIVSVGGISTPFLTVGLGIAAIIATSAFIRALWDKKRAVSIAIFLAILLSNINTVSSMNGNGQTLFSIQKDMVLAKELQAVNYTYGEAKGQSFSINTLTSPLWINITWSYLYNWYGKEKYGFLPQWHGRNQIGQLGNNLSDTSPETQLYFFIIEPMQGIPGHYLSLEIGAEDANSTVVEEKSFGEIRVQKRMRKE